ncbi:hypothetical protein GCM10022381_04320 [Leifsonia kafniensis]|uniref:Uncharacterized protein n=1 Tax=Leifsonia kafniensis TaxID=475957 RepID=A0ABP7K2A1_9MICO
MADLTREPVQSDPQPEHDAWSALLDELEASLGEAALGAAATTAHDADSSWSEPAGLGPIPPDLVDRARDILGGQRELIAELVGERRAVGEQLAALRQVPSQQARAVYLDITG